MLSCWLNLIEMGLKVGIEEVELGSLGTKKEEGAEIGMSIKEKEPKREEKATLKSLELQRLIGK